MCTPTQSVVYYSVSCQCNTWLVVYCSVTGSVENYSVGCRLRVGSNFGDGDTFRDYSQSRSVVYYSVSCALLGQLCITRSVVYYTVSCVTLRQLCITRSVVYYSVGGALLGQLCITPSVV